MIRRNFPNSDVDVPILGFGCMRLPVIDNDVSKIDFEKAIPLVRSAIDNGVNYLDTAYIYHGGNSEAFVGEVIKDGYAEKVSIATKLPHWFCEKYEDFDRYFNEQLSLVGVENFDFYLIHNIDRNAWNKLLNLGLLEWMDKIKSQGKVKNIGFSFHDGLKIFKEIVDAYDWDFCQIQLNYMDRYIQAGIEGLKYAHDKGLGVIIMEPLKGGQLAKEPPESVKMIWDRADIKRSPVEWSLRYLYSLKEVSCVLSGMSDVNQLSDNVRIAESAYVDCIDEAEMNIIDDVYKAYMKLIKVPCTSCQYCMPCPFGVDIPANFENYNLAYMHDAFEFAHKMYNRPVFGNKRAAKCKLCGLCKKKCPQHIDIPSVMKHIVREFEK